MIYFKSIYINKKYLLKSKFYSNYGKKILLKLANLQITSATFVFFLMELITYRLVHNFNQILYLH